MKTLLIKLQILSLIFLTHFVLKAQNEELYPSRGGTADGYATETIENKYCATPFHQFAYFGGVADGAEVDTKADNSCGTPAHFFAYFGGDNDGAAVETLANNICDTPFHFYAYFGGVGDGFSMNATPNICPVNPPVASFTASKIEVCLGESITFTDTSTNLPSSWEWTFAGGTPATANVKTPIVQYNTAGTYDVKLKVTNFNGTDTITKTAYIVVYAAPVVSSIAPTNRCGSGTVTIGATASVGTIKWYDALTGGNLLATGNSFTTPNLTNSTTYFAEAVNGVCSSIREAVTATINTIPMVTSSMPNSRCGAGSVVLQATASSGAIKWYDTPTGGNLIGTGNSFSTPIINNTTSYYAEALDGNCNSARTEIIATINTMPTITSTTPENRCGAGSLLLVANSSAGTIKWYDAPTAGNLLATGNSFTTPVINISTTYFAEVSNANCTSGRVAVLAEIKQTATPTVNSTQNFCNGDILNNVPIVGTNIIWYDAPSNGNVITGSTLLTNSAIYYVTQTVSGCESNRVAVTMNLSTGCLGTREITSAEVKVYPVPIVDVLHVISPEEIYKIEVYSLSGQKIFSKEYKLKKVEIDFQSYPAAGYLIRVYTKENVKDIKVIKK